MRIDLERPLLYGPIDYNGRDEATVDQCSVFIVLVVSLDPAVHGVRVLLNELNRTHNFSQFCKEIRKKFKESINSTS